MERRRRIGEEARGKGGGGEVGRRRGKEDTR